jgi:hypothetical protein
MRITILIATAAAVGSAILGGGTANASPQDDRFIQLLQSEGFDTVNAADEVRAAQDVCKLLAGGAHGDKMVQTLVTHDQFSQAQATQLINASITVYCPNYPPIPG